MNALAAPLAAARKRKSKWAIGVAIALVVIIAAAAAFTLLRTKSSTTSSLSTSAAQRQTLSVLVSGSGTAVVADAVTVNPQISGTVEKLYVSLGETVSAGDRLYTISSDDVETARLQAKASLLQSKQSLSQANSSKQQASSQLYSARTAQIQAQQSLDDLESQPATTPGVADKITIAKRQLTSAKKSVTSAKASIASSEIGIDVAQANYTSAKQSYNDAVDSTNDTVVTAPIDGVVTALPISVGSDVSGGSSSSSSGGSMSASTVNNTSSSTSSSSGSSITISDMGSLEVEVSISEADITSVAVEQTATVTFDAISDATFAGTVKSVSPNGTTSSGVVTYTVRLSIKNPDDRLKPAMTATADIGTQVVENVVTVPSAAVKTQNGSKYVVVLKDGVSTNKDVTVGVSDDTNTEIESGVSAGDIVVTGSTTAASTTSPSSRRGGTGGLMMGGGGTPPSGGPPGRD